MILLLLRECSCLLTKYLLEGVGLPENPIHLHACVLKVRPEPGGWVMTLLGHFIQAATESEEYHCCTVRSLLLAGYVGQKSWALPLGDLGGSVSTSG